MKTFIIISFCATFLLTAVYAQEPDKPLIKVRYSFIHIQNTTQRNKPYTENMLLLAGRNASLYTSYDRMEQVVGMSLQREEMEKSGFTGQQINDRYRAQQQQQPQFSSTDYYFFAREHKCFFRSDICLNGCLVEDQAEKIDWKVVKDTMSIIGVPCQKAVAHFKGRNWIAWFDPALPLSCGPWKLNGLPGLILEAYDDKKEVQFKFESMSTVKEGDYSVEDAHRLSQHDLSRILNFLAGLDESRIGLPEKRGANEGGLTMINQKEFERMKEAYNKDPAAFRYAQLVAAGAGEKAGKSAPPKPVKNLVNNPIELPEKNE